jgi:UDP-N-acetylglucosamine 2-epimerase (non-hydrolysing)
MDKVFFEQPGLPEAKYDLDAGSGMNGEQTGKMLVGIEKFDDPETEFVCEETGEVLF